jgi:chromosome segregation ATPase
MKLNPLNRKSNGYFARIKSEFLTLERELTDAQTALETAEAELERLQRRHQQLTEQGTRYVSSPEEKLAALAVSEARNRVSEIRGDVAQLQSRIAPLKRLATAPEALVQAKGTLDELHAQRKAAMAESERTTALITKLNQRVADLEQRIASEMQSATATLLNDESDFVVPESLTRLEAELRLAKASLTELHNKQEALQQQCQELPVAIREAEQQVTWCRAITTEIELYEQLQPVMPALARAAVARRQTGALRDARRFEIEIPPERLESAEAGLAAELTGR